MIHNGNSFYQNLWGSGIFCAAGWFLLWSLSWGCNQDVGQDWSHLTTSMRLEDLLQRRPTERQLLAEALSSSLAICGKPQFLSMRTCLQACPSVLVVGFPQNKQSTKKLQCLYDLASEVTLRFCTLFWLCRLALLGMRGSNISVNTNTQKSCGPTWRLAKNYSQIFKYFNVVI